VFTLTEGFSAIFTDIDERFGHPGSGPAPE
jgi:hypothetical protein